MHVMGTYLFTFIHTSFYFMIANEFEFLILLMKANDKFPLFRRIKMNGVMLHCFIILQISQIVKYEIKLNPMR